MALFDDDDDGYWAQRFAITPDQLQQMQAQAADQARQDYADQTQAMANDPSAGSDDGSADGGGTDKFQTAYQAQLDGMMGGSGSRGSPPQPPSAPQPAAPPQTFNPSQMNVSDNGVKFIRDRETFKPSAYVDGDPGHTIGWGHKLLPGESFPNGISGGQAEKLFQNDLADAENIVRSHVTAPLNQNQYDALVSLAYNAGYKPFLPKNSIPKALNKGDYAGAAKAFGLWSGPPNHMVVVPGLVTRRGAEMNVFNTPPGN